MRATEEAVLANENHVDLSKGAVEGAVIDGENIVSDEAGLLHEVDDVIELRAADHGAKEGDFEDDGFGLLEGTRGTGKNLELGALDIELYEERTGEVFLRTLLINGDDGNGAGRAVDGSAFDLGEKAGAEFVVVDVERGGAGGLAGSGENVLGFVSRADLAEERLEFDEGLDQENAGVLESFVKLRSGIGDASVYDSARLEAESRQLSETAGHAGARRG